MNRRTFLKHKAALVTGMMIPWSLSAAPEFLKLTILHTNDVHSRIEPFPEDGSWRAGRGGVSRRSSLIQQIRALEPHVLLLDSGDIFQGTPYFNMFGGELEFRLMSEMGYNAATLGNHDFDAGLDGLLKQMPYADFPFVISNYNFKDTLLEGKTLPYKTFKKGGVKIGILGVGIELEGLVPAALYGGTRYEDPIARANEYASLLRNDLKCDYIICLSHLGYQYNSAKVSDIILATSSRHIDLILGGHTHTFMDEPKAVANLDGKEVLINQVGWGGMMLGRIDIQFERNSRNKCVSCNNSWVG